MKTDQAGIFETIYGVLSAIVLWVGVWYIPHWIWFALFLGLSIITAIIVAHTYKTVVKLDNGQEYEVLEIKKVRK